MDFIFNKVFHSSSFYIFACVIIDLLTKTNGNTDPDVMRDALVGLVTEAPPGTLIQNPNAIATIDACIAEARKIDGEFVWEPIELLQRLPYPGYYTKPE